MISVSRRYRFSASHRLHSPELSAARNEQVFGKCNNPFGHGHDYVLEITAGGPVDFETGLILPVAKLDQLAQEEVLRPFAHRNINSDVPQFATLIPTTENVALVIADLLQQHWTEYLGHTRARLLRVRLQETERNAFEILLNTESVTVNA
ncbi:MAG: 6-carboxytetrahydropterin synthase [Bryobacteraceae bacterium]